MPRQGFMNTGGKGVIAVEKSGNEKVGKISITYASQVTCPSTCPLKDAGCYAELGRIGMITSKLNQSTMTAIEVAHAEAEQIRELAKVSIRPLRLHGVGDCSTPESAEIVSEACLEYKGPVYSYTHAAATVPRSSWNNVSILASCETMEQVMEAQERGYATAMVVGEHPADGKAWVDEGTGQKIIPCPQQTRLGVTCNSCRMCMDDKSLLARRATIAFAAHGQRSRRVREMLKMQEVSV